MREGGPATVDGQQSTENNYAVDWFESRLGEVRVEIKNLYQNFTLSEALKIIYSLIWDDFCSWYLEWVKPGFEQPIEKAVYEKTVYFFEELMLMLHPFMPFITEEIYHQLKERKPGDDLTIKQSEGRLYGEGLILLHGSLLKDFITSIRDTRNKNQLKPKDQITIYVKPYKDLFSATELILRKQVNAEEIIYTDKPVADSIVVVVKNFKFYLKTKLTIDTSIQKDQLLKDLEYQKGFLLSVEKKLSNERFVQNAKPEVVEVEKKKKADAEAKIKAIEESLERL